MPLPLIIADEERLKGESDTRSEGIRNDIIEEGNKEQEIFGDQVNIVEIDQKINQIGDIEVGSIITYLTMPLPIITADDVRIKGDLDTRSEGNRI
ncbi:MAG: hypothetical protein EZS28_017602 [Streblomastix strix]|uniref:Uncharacterized protein n=1 Tax=Streblomastix strix TaxID=222440 RepID=A0A5J4VW08_9EUKA|nr:MAG: hypothetical protein EZS28_017602 [Streblomastix strix]